MADLNNDPLESRTRANLAYMLIGAAIIMLSYVLYRWGDKTEILTLVLGLIGGTMVGAPIGVYFAGGLSKKTPDTSVSGDNTTVNNTPTEDVK